MADSNAVEGASAFSAPVKANTEAPIIAPKDAHNAGAEPLWFAVHVPDAVKEGQLLEFQLPDGTRLCAKVPPGKVAGERFMVQVWNGIVRCPRVVTVPVGQGAGDDILVDSFEKQQQAVRVPSGVAAGQTFTAFFPVTQPRDQLMPLAPADLKVWLDAARAFKMNTDFEVSGAADVEELNLWKFMEAMKTQSAGKRTIQAIGDKILMSKMLHKMNIPQMPLLLAIQESSDIKAEVNKFLEKCSRELNENGVFIKPTHLSNGEGALCLGAIDDEKKQGTADFLESHVSEYLQRSACDWESEALKSLRPGIIAQPKYKSCVEFDMPLEIRVISLWGKARTGIWWWGSEGSSNESHRTAWMVRRQRVADRLSDDDTWEAIHQHQCENKGFEVALKLFQEHMPALTTMTEAIATAVGAPFLRADFFVGSTRWGVRLNELAYGSGTELRRPNARGGDRLIDDAAAVSQILQQGMACCTTCMSPEHFLSQVGVSGDTYIDLEVDPAFESSIDVLKNPICVGALTRDYDHYEVPRHLCETLKVGPNAEVAQLFRVRVPEGAAAGSLVAFAGPDDGQLLAHVPQGVQVGQDFEVQIASGQVLQPCPVVVPEGHRPGDALNVRDASGAVSTFLVPEGVSAGQSFTAMVPVSISFARPRSPDAVTAVDNCRCGGDWLSRPWWLKALKPHHKKKYGMVKPWA